MSKEEEFKKELCEFGVDLIRELKKEFCSTAIPGEVEELKRKLVEQESMVKRLKAQLEDQRKLAELLYRAAYAMEAWGSQEDGIPDMNLGTRKMPINPYQVYLDISPYVCSRLGYQNCSFCSCFRCGDNTTKRDE